MRKIKVDILVNFMVEVPEGTKPEDLYIEVPTHLVGVCDAKGAIITTATDYYTDEVIVQDDVQVTE